MKNRVEYQEIIQESIERIPFLKRFMVFYTNDLFSMDVSKVNKYMKYEFCSPGDQLTSEFMNKILEEAEKRGDL